MLDSPNGFAKNNDTVINNENANKYCWRLYVQFGIHKTYKWFLFGVSQFGVDVTVRHTHKHPTLYGIIGDVYMCYRNGCGTPDTAISFLYENDINQIDMLLDCNNGTLSYKLIDDNQDREYVINGLNTDMKWIPIFDCRWEGGKLQVAQIPVSMYGRGKHYVKWTVTY